jgi:RNA polymerase sigma-70 factor (ECF subfamily)
LRYEATWPLPDSSSYCRTSCRSNETFDATDWQQIALLYGALMEFIPSSVVAMNRAVAIAFSDGVEKGLTLLDDIASSRRLDDYYLFHATRADFLKRLQRYAAAKEAYIRALAICENQAERHFLEARLVELASET